MITYPRYLMPLLHLLVVFLQALIGYFLGFGLVFAFPLRGIWFLGFISVLSAVGVGWTGAIIKVIWSRYYVKNILSAFIGSLLGGISGMLLIQWGLLPFFNAWEVPLSSAIIGFYLLGKIGRKRNFRNQDPLILPQANVEFSGQSSRKDQ